MYNNIGGKIKGLIRFLFGIEVFGCVLAALALVYLHEKLSSFIIVLGLAAIVIMLILGWMSTWVFYAYGELVEKTCQIEEHIRNLQMNVTYREAPASETPVAVPSAVTTAAGDRLASLERLRSQNLISEEEYQQLAAKEQ